MSVNKPNITAIIFTEGLNMKKYIKTATATSEKVVVETPYNSYEFDTEHEAQEFENFVNADPDYDDPELGDIIEWMFFYKKNTPRSEW